MASINEGVLKTQTTLPESMISVLPLIKSNYLNTCVAFMVHFPSSCGFLVKLFPYYELAIGYVYYVLFLASIKTISHMHNNGFV